MKSVMSLLSSRNLGTIYQIQNEDFASQNLLALLTSNFVRFTGVINHLN